MSEVIAEVRQGNKCARHVEATIRYTGNFQSEEEFEEWFVTASYHVVHRDPQDDNAFNFNYKVEIVKDRYGHTNNYIHLEFDTNKDESIINNVIRETIENDYADGNYQVNGQVVSCAIMSVSISNA